MIKEKKFGVLAIHNLKETMAKKITPLMKQYFEIREQYPDSILLFQVGDFYEIFFEDAKKAAFDRQSACSQVRGLKSSGKASQGNGPSRSR